MQNKIINNLNQILFNRKLSITSNISLMN